MITAEEVRYCYLFMLGREPESEDVVRSHMAAHSTVDSLRKAVLGCAEFNAKHPQIGAEISKGYWEKQARIDTDVSTDMLSKMLDRVRDQWSALGEADPYWSVLSADEFKIGRLDEKTVRQFYETGQQAVQVLDAFQNRTGLSVPKGTCFELGCGVGRLTRFLAQRFDKVIAADISPGNLAICDEYMRRNGIKNVETMILRNPADIARMPAFDFFVSFIVLQHNPPPIQKHLLDLIFSRIAPNGGALFQTPELMPNYSFDAEKFAEAEGVFEMHCLPKATILSLLKKHGLALRDIALDNWTGEFGSYTYFALK